MKQYNTVKISTGFCRACGAPNGYEKETTTGQLVNEFSDCTCHQHGGAHESEVTRAHQQAYAGWTKKEKEVIA